MIFLGERDDREALCLAKRAMRDPRIKLVVYHLAPKEYNIDLECIRDNEVLEGIKKPEYGLESVSYRRVTVNDGPETFNILHDIVNEHGFFIVGRRHDFSLNFMSASADNGTHLGPPLK
ncbi:cation/H(+) antiporter 4-like [Gastrolobium bilobum]|uniref:cation/H(+) antiporter 4-like n=1 Tax=Gastrolobium bilobum TaxID=150636 RepID=UPI002AAFB53A|nr:cation/H(+) antiporter 4-like [Gastrolobium bilobum]